MKKNEHGFTVVEVFIIILIILVISFVAWRVSANDPPAKSEPAAIDAGINDEIVNDESYSESTEETVNEDAITQPDKILFTYTTPDGWSSENLSNRVVLTAPGTTKKDIAYEDIITGAIISLSCSNNTYKNLDQFKSKNIIYSDYSASKQELKVNSAPAVQYVVGYEGPKKRFTTFFVGTSECSAGIEEDVYINAEYASKYNIFIDSIKF